MGLGGFLVFMCRCFGVFIVGVCGAMGLSSWVWGCFQQREW